MASNLRIKVNAAGAVAKIKALQDAAGDMQPVFATVGRAIKTRIDLCFRLGIDPWGSPWAALKVRKGGQPLKDKNRTGLSRIIVNPDSTGVTIGTAAIGKIAGTHQFGATILAKNGRKFSVPARPYLPLRKSGAVEIPPAWSPSVTRALRTYFTNEAKKAGD